jgi:hypothetical protein
MCPKCGQPSFSVEKNQDIALPDHSLTVCRACWWERQVARIDGAFASLSSCEHAHDSSQPLEHYGIAPLDPGMTRGEKRHVVRKYEPMGG